MRRFLPPNACSIALALTFAVASALADNIDNLARALFLDPSYRVRVQAASVLGKLKDPRGVDPLIRALRDSNQAVRAVAAASLGAIGRPEANEALEGRKEDRDPNVRAAAEKALSAIARAQAAASAAAASGKPTGSTRPIRYRVAVLPFVPGKGDEPAAERLRQRVTDGLTALDGVGVGEPPPGTKGALSVEGNIATLDSTPAGDGRVTIECGVRFLVATWPDHSIKVMATAGASIETDSDDESQKATRRTCLDNAATQVTERVAKFLVVPQ